jgi:hypothetical protein
VAGIHLPALPVEAAAPPAVRIVHQLGLWHARGQVAGRLGAIGDQHDRRRFGAAVVLAGHDGQRAPEPGPCLGVRPQGRLRPGTQYRKGLVVHGPLEADLAADPPPVLVDGDRLHPPLAPRLQGDLGRLDPYGGEGPGGNSEGVSAPGA